MSIYRKICWFLIYYFVIDKYGFLELELKLVWVKFLSKFFYLLFQCANFITISWLVEIIEWHYLLLKFWKFRQCLFDTIILFLLRWLFSNDDLTIHFDIFILNLTRYLNLIISSLWLDTFEYDILPLAILSAEWELAGIVEYVFLLLFFYYSTLFADDAVITQLFHSLRSDLQGW